MMAAWIVFGVAGLLIGITDGQMVTPLPPPGLSPLPGPKGQKGEFGFVGFPGVPGLPGEKGQKGQASFKPGCASQGLPGLDGFPGLKGNVGQRGPGGYPGLPQLPGQKGDTGSLCIPIHPADPSDLNVLRRRICLDEPNEVIINVTKLRANVTDLETAMNEIQNQVGIMTDVLTVLKSGVNAMKANADENVNAIDEDEGSIGDVLTPGPHDDNAEHEETSRQQLNRPDDQESAPDLERINTPGGTTPLPTDTTRRLYHGSVEMPEPSEISEYIFAKCDVKPNTALKPQQPVYGRVTFWQKKTGGRLNAHMDVRRFPDRDSHSHHGRDSTRRRGRSRYGYHGFHIHESGDLSNGCESTGPHYNPLNANHGGPKSLERHVGDLGDIVGIPDGIKILFVDSLASLLGEYSIIGRALVIHADPDDFGLKKDDEESQKTGNVGARIACCVVEETNPIPLEPFKNVNYIRH